MKLKQQDRWQHCRIWNSRGFCSSVSFMISFFFPFAFYSFLYFAFYLSLIFIYTMRCSYLHRRQVFSALYGSAQRSNPNPIPLLQPSKGIPTSLRCHIFPTGAALQHLYCRAAVRAWQVQIHFSTFSLKFLSTYLVFLIFS